MHELSHRSMWNTRLLPFHVLPRGQLFGRMMRTSGEFDPTVVSAIQKLRCEHQIYPPTRGGSYLSEWEPAVYLFGLTTGMNLLSVILIDLSDLFGLLTRGVGLRQPFSRSTGPIQNLRAHQQFYCRLFFGCDGVGRRIEPATTRVLVQGGIEVPGMGAGSCTPFVEGFIRRLL